MFDPTDPRASLSSSSPPIALPGEFAAAEYARFYDEAPQESTLEGRTWYLRGQNFIVAYTLAEPGAVLGRPSQPDEYMVLIPRAETTAEVSAGAEARTVKGHSLIILPPGESRIVVPQGGEIVRLFTTRSPDLAAKCANAASYVNRRANLPPFEAWPAPPDGYRIRSYSLDVPAEPGRFGRIFRCTTLMVNVLDPQEGPRDVTKLSPHHHDDFEQGSLALQGAFTHHLRWPWTPNMNHWREDEHAILASPSLTVIPPPAIHTSRGMNAGINQLVDIFSPPRLDFSAKPGWVLNADDYPMPPPSASAA